MARRITASGTQAFPTFAAVPAISDGFYSGDRPNPSLRRFVEEHCKPYDPARDDCSVEAYNQQITIDKRKSESMDLHIYWSKKHHDAIRHYIEHFTSPGDLVLDPFCGSGGTALVAVQANRAAVAVDVSPAAAFITRNYCAPVVPRDVEVAFNEVERTVRNEIDWLYETRCDRCGGKATTSYTVFSQVFQCRRCLTKVPLFDCVEVQSQTSAGKPKTIAVCPDCHSKGHDEEISTRTESFGAVPVLVSYLCKSGCKPIRAERKYNDIDEKKRRYFEEYDLAKIQEIESKPIPHWCPPQKMMNVEDDSLPWGFEWREGRNFRTVTALYTKRNLWALAAIMAACQSSRQKEFLAFVLNTAVLTVSRMCRHDYPSVMAGSYYIPQINRELNVWENFAGRVPRKLSGISSIMAQMPSAVNLLISCQSATNMDQIPSCSVDYIFTDPPYAEKVQYGELNFIWEAWLGLATDWHDDEIIVNATRGRTEADWADMMRQAMAECFRVLKPGRWISLCYHDTSEGTWELVQDIMAEVGFIVDRSDATLFIDTGQKSYNQLTADKTTKRDLVINFRKPRPGDWRITQVFIPADVDVPTFQELGREVIREFLTAHPGAPKDRIYDELVSRMVRKGQMEAHDFDGLLRTIAEEVRQPVKADLLDNREPDLFGSHVTSRWYLKDTADSIDRAEQEKEDSAAERLAMFMLRCLNENPEQEGVHYSDLFEQYLPVADKPRRLLADWLPEYFFKTTDGTWRPPADEHERQQKAVLREAGTLRRMKRFANALIDGVPVREQDRPTNDRTLAEWIRQCRRAGLYEQGRALYEKGGLNLENLTDEEQITAEDDYRICAKRKGEDESKPKRGRRKKDAEE